MNKIPPKTRRYSQFNQKQLRVGMHHCKVAVIIKLLLTQLILEKSITNISTFFIFLYIKLCLFFKVLLLTCNRQFRINPNLKDPAEVKLARSNGGGLDKKRGLWRGSLVWGLKYSLAKYKIIEIFKNALLVFFFPVRKRERERQRLK